MHSTHCPDLSVPSAHLTDAQTPFEQQNPDIVNYVIIRRFIESFVGKNHNLCNFTYFYIIIRKLRYNYTASRSKHS